MAAEDRKRRSLAPFVVFGGMGLIGICSVAVVAIGHCQRDEPYMDSVILDRGETARGAPTPSPAPGQWGTEKRERKGAAGDNSAASDDGAASDDSAASDDGAAPAADGGDSR